MRKKKPLASAVVFLLFFTALIATTSVKLTQANPYLDYGWVSPPKDAIPLEISMSSPKNNSIYRANDIDLNVNINTNNTSVHYLLDAYFKADWMQDNVTIYKQNICSPEFPDFWGYTKSFVDLPDGNYSIVITARGGGGYAEGLTYYFFDMTTVSILNFTIDTTPPKVSILSPKNETYESCNVSLSFTVNEKQSLIRYNLDGQKNATLYRNTILTNLPNGEHSVTLYVWDVAGNPGLPKTVVFEIAESALESFPTIMVIAPVALLSGIGSCLVVYLRKRKR